MKALLLLLLTACWSGTDRTITVIRPVAHYIHDVPRECPGLSAFPAISAFGHGAYVRMVARWITVAGVCLNVPTYDLTNLLEEVQW